MTQVKCHDSFSTNTLTLPPQASPTSQARSCVTPKSSSCGTPESIVFIAASATAPSIQPPDTDPAILPDLVTAIWLPAGRGELPQVSVTVATATCSPAARQVAAVERTSSVSDMIGSLAWRGSREKINQPAQAVQAMH